MVNFGIFWPKFALVSVQGLISTTRGTFEPKTHPRKKETTPTQKYPQKIYPNFVGRVIKPHCKMWRMKTTDWKHLFPFCGMCIQPVKVRLAVQLEFAVCWRTSKNAPIQWIQTAFWQLDNTWITVWSNSWTSLLFSLMTPIYKWWWSRNRKSSKSTAIFFLHKSSIYSGVFRKYKSGLIMLYSLSV